MTLSGPVCRAFALALALGLAAASGRTVAAADAARGDAEAGRELALERCAECHLVAEDQGGATIARFRAAALDRHATCGGSR